MRRQRIAELGPTRLNERAGGRVFDVDVKLQTAADAVAHRHLDTAEVIRMQLDTDTAVARHAVELRLMDDLRYDLRGMCGRRLDRRASRRAGLSNRGVEGLVVAGRCRGVNRRRVVECED